MGTLVREEALLGADATAALGRRVAAQLRPGDFVGLRGELGAGKTTLVRALAESLGVASDEIASPTFSIFHPYAARPFRLWHADLYRLSSRQELDETGFPELCGGPDVVLVEWLDRVPDAAPAEHLVIELLHVDRAARHARLIGHGARGRALAAAI